MGTNKNYPCLIFDKVTVSRTSKTSDLTLLAVLHNLYKLMLMQSCLVLGKHYQGKMYRKIILLLVLDHYSLNKGHSTCNWLHKCVDILKNIVCDWEKFHPDSEDQFIVPLGWNWSSIIKSHTEFVPISQELWWESSTDVLTDPLAQAVVVNLQEDFQ